MPLDFPTSPTNGQSFGSFTYDSSLPGWRSTPEVASGLPAGTIAQWGGSTAPANWLICDGSAVSRSTYASLFAAIGTTHGVGDGSTTFNLPDLRGRTAIGAGAVTDSASQTQTFTLGAKAGELKHAQTVSEMPSHTHVQDAHNHTQNAHTHTQDSHNHVQDSHYHGTSNYNGGGNAQGRATTNAGPHGDTNYWNFYGSVGYSSVAQPYIYGTTATNQSTTATNNATTATNQNTGGGTAFNVMQPYTVLHYIIKTSAGVTAGDSELATRVGATETVNTTQNTRLTAIETLNTTQDSRLTSLETAVPSVGWTAYTPSFSNITIGNGSTAFYYQKVGRVVHVRGIIIYGSTTSFNGACDFSHPAMATTYNILHPMGYAEFYGPNLRHGRIVRINDTYSRFVCDYVSGTTVANAELSNTYPFTWASGYWAMLSMSYETG